MYKWSQRKVLSTFNSNDISYICKMGKGELIYFNYVKETLYEKCRYLSVELLTVREFKWIIFIKGGHKIVVIFVTAFILFIATKLEKNCSCDLLIEYFYSCTLVEYVDNCSGYLIFIMWIISNHIFPLGDKFRFIVLKK